MRVKVIVLLSVFCFLSFSTFVLWAQKQVKQEKPAVKKPKPLLEQLETELKSPTISESIEEPANYQEVDPELRSFFVMSVAVQRLLRPRSELDYRETYDQPLLKILNQFPEDTIYGEYYSTLKLKPILELVQLRTARQDGDLTLQKTLINKLSGYENLVTEYTMRGFETAGRDFPKIVDLNAMIDVYYQEGKFKECWLLANQGNLTKADTSVAFNLEQEGIFCHTVRLFQNKPLDPKLMSTILNKSRKFNSDAQYGIYNSISKHFQIDQPFPDDKNRTKQLETLKRFAEAYPFIAVWNDKEACEYIVSLPYELLKAYMMDGYDCSLKHLSASEKTELSLIYGKLCNTYKIMAKYDEYYKTALKEFALPLEKGKTSAILNPEKVKKEIRVITLLKGFETAVEKNSAQISLYADSLITLCGKDYSYNGQNIYSNVKFDLANYYMQTKEYDKALILFKELKEEKEYKAISDVITQYQYRGPLVSINAEAILPLQTLYCSNKLDLKKGRELCLEVLANYSDYVDAYYRRDALGMHSISLYLDALQDSCQTEEYEQTIKEFTGKTTSRIIRAHLLTKLAEYYQETKNNTKAIEIWTKIRKDFPYDYYYNSHDVPVAESRYFQVEALDHLIELSKADPVQKKKLEQKRASIYKSFEIIRKYVQIQ